MAEAQFPLGVTFNNVREVQYLLSKAEAAFDEIARIHVGLFDATIQGTYQRDRLDSGELETIASALIRSRRRKLTEISRQLSKFGVFLSPDEPQKPVVMPAEKTHAR